MNRRVYQGAAILAAVMAIPATLVAAASARNITLKPSDLPAGYHQTTAQTVSNAQMAQKTGLSKAQFDQRGRLTGYDTDYVTSAAVGSPAYAGIGSKAYTYKTASGAHWDFTEAVAVDSGKGASRVAVARVGDESTALTGTQKSGKTTYTIDVIIFRRGATDMAVVVIGAKGKVTLNTVLHYAHIMDARASH